MNEKKNIIDKPRMMSNAFADYWEDGVDIVPVSLSDGRQLEPWKSPRTYILCRLNGKVCDRGNFVECRVCFMPIFYPERAKELIAELPGND